MDPHQDRRRGHFHRGRRGPDRRGFDRRAPAQPQPPQARDQVEVEQIMREIRARIAQRQGVELTHQQVDDLAARRLEYILDPRAMKPEFLDTLRRSADEALEREEKRLPTEPVYSFEATTLYDSHRAILRFVRKLLNPLLKLLFNPNPLIRALHLQAELNVEAAARDAARDRRQAEWNALHYKIIHRLVTEVSRVSLDVQALSARVESLGSRVDFNDRRVRAMEGTMHQARPAARPPEAPPPVRLPEAAAAPATEAASAPEAGGAQPDAARRRRRRRRGRRGGGMGMEAAQAAAMPTAGQEPPSAEPEAGVVDAADEPGQPEPAPSEPPQPEPAAWTAEPPMAPAAPPSPEPRVEEPEAPPPPAADHDDSDRLE
jgi:hypothetical protein